MISMDDVALQAKVSKATVSRVLNGKLPVSAAVREKVIDACQKLNYRLNSNIQDLVLKSRTGATRNIAFVLVGRELTDPAYTRLIEGLSTVANDWHYHLMLVKISGTEENIYELPPVIRDERVDGILLAGALTTHTTELMLKLGLNCVAIGNYRDQVLRSMGSVQLNLETIFYGLIEQLIATGKRRIALVEEAPESYVTEIYINIYKRTLQDAGIGFDENICYLGNGSGKGMFAALTPIFAQPDLPFDAIVCTDMRIANEVSHLLVGHFGLGVNIPVTLATFRDFEYYQLPLPALYATFNSKGQVESAVRMLAEQIEGQGMAQKIVLQ